MWKAAANIRGEREPGDDFKHTTFFHFSEKRNILDMRIERNGSEQFHEYIVRGNFKEAKVPDGNCKNNSYGFRAEPYR
jgi:hypothetical protein